MEEASAPQRAPHDPSPTPGAQFPRTRVSIVSALAADDEATRRRSYERLIESYWRPVYKSLRLHWRLDAHSAEDLTQGFFAHALEKQTLDAFDPARARFRTWLRRCLEGYVANTRKHAMRQKRGGDQRPLLTLDFSGAEAEICHVAGGGAGDDVFDREWMRSLLARAVDRIRSECADSDQEAQFRVFERYDLEGPESGESITYANLGVELGLTVQQVTNTLHRMRTRLRAAVVADLRTICASPEELDDELRELFGRSPG